MTTAPTILLMTVGVGDPAKLEETLYTPLLKSIDQGAWRRVVLLPSTETRPHAEVIRDRRPDLAFDIRAFDHPQTENDVDACFAFLDIVIADLLRNGAVPADLAADFTRGTKAMSAALVMAAVRRGIRELRYIEGEREKGTVKPGTEKVRNFYPLKAVAGHRFDACRTLLRRGAFTAATDLLADDILDAEEWDNELRDKAKAPRGLARFLAAWDRLDYCQAKCELAALEKRPLAGDWVDFTPPEGVAAWIDSLAAKADRTNMPFMAERCRRLAVDLTANAERCVAQGRYEDALVCGYRVWELLGQAALFRHGFDSGEMPASDGRVVAFIERLKKNNSNLPGRHPKCTEKYQFSREQVARFLKHLDDPVGNVLLEFGKDGHPGAVFRNRNISILIHGFEAQGPRDHKTARELLNGLAGLLGADALANLEIARWPGRLDGTG